MTVVSAWRIAPFNSKVHDRSAFSCGAPELDTYIRRLASQDMRRDVARVFVATGSDAEIAESDAFKALKNEPFPDGRFTPESFPGLFEKTK